ncbi:hypothetical protein [Dysgonomonas macrotermitis]|nr:hypothetical protein [Dysgonomonas macrotermitis]
MMKKCLFFVFLIIALTGCSSYSEMLSADSNMKKVELDMTKEQVIAIMGSNYQRVGSFRLEDSTYVEMLGFKRNYNETYVMRFENGILTEWNKEVIPEYPAPVNTNTVSK